MVPSLLLGGVQFQVMTRPQVVLNAGYIWLPILFKFSSLCQCCFHLSAVLAVRQLKALCLISVSFEEPMGRLTKKKNTGFKLGKEKEQKYISTK